MKLNSCVLMGACLLLLAFVSARASLCLAQESESILEPGKTPGERRVLTIDGVEFPFRWAPKGEFDMGSPEDEADREQYEVLHRVTLTKGFWILETETTQKMWAVVNDDNPSKWQGETLPVDTVSFDDCVAFLDALSKRAALPKGAAFKLPTEAQWEYVARSGKSAKESGATGGRELSEIAWFGDEDYGGSHPVATKAPNDWGVYDMLGNLWEWCADRTGDFKVDSEGRGLAVVDPQGADEVETPANIRVDRGGCWDSHDYECRFARRGYYDGDRKGPYVGFRFTFVPQCGE